MKIQLDKIEPREDRVIIRPDKVEENSNGIIIPENAKDKTQSGVVVSAGIGKKAKLLADNAETQELIEAIGPKAFFLLKQVLAACVTIDTDLKPGDHVYFGKYAGTEITIDGENLLIVRDADVWGKVR